MAVVRLLQQLLLPWLLPRLLPWSLAWLLPFLAATLTLGTPGTAQAADTPPPPPELTAGQAQRDLRILERAFTALHPGLYRYTTPDAMQAAFAAANAAVAQGASRAQLYLLATRLAAAVHCGHTWTNPSNQPPALRRLLDGADKLPLTIRGVPGLNNGPHPVPNDVANDGQNDVPNDVVNDGPDAHGQPGNPRWLVTGSAVPGVAAGAELLSINGRTPAQITALLLPYLRADGLHNDGKRVAQIDHDANGGALDRLLPLLLPPAGGLWQLRVRDHGSNTGSSTGTDTGEDSDTSTAATTDTSTAASTATTTATNSITNTGKTTPRTVSVAAVTVAERTRRIAAAPPILDWTFTISGDTAHLTLPTFAFWDQRFDGSAFLDRAFATLAAQRVPFLVIDIRANEGGDDALGHALLAHLIQQPFDVPGSRRESAYERVPYVLARHLDTWDFGFFDRTGQVARGPGRNWLMPDAPPRRIEPVSGPVSGPGSTPYRGRVLLLVGPNNSSAGYLLARDAKASGAALLVGRPTGGNQRGLNGGQLAWVTLPASGVAVDIPLVANFAPGEPPDGGVMPDVLVNASFDEAAAGIDAEMQAAQRLIDGWRRAR